MQNRDIVVIGGSAGALEPLRLLLGNLPADLPAALFVVVHTGANAHGTLARAGQGRPVAGRSRA